jgi:hypothetical protein
LKKCKTILGSSLDRGELEFSLNSTEHKVCSFLLQLTVRNSSKFRIYEKLEKFLKLKIENHSKGLHFPQIIPNIR